MLWCTCVTGESTTSASHAVSTTVSMSSKFFTLASFLPWNSTDGLLLAAPLGLTVRSPKGQPRTVAAPSLPSTAPHRLLRSKQWVKTVSPGPLHRASLSFSSPQVQATPFCPVLRRILLLPSASRRRLSLAGGAWCVQKPSRFRPTCAANPDGSGQVF
jgi:hypothetical protein